MRRRPPGSRSVEKRIREALATPGRPGVRVIAKRFGVDPGTVQRISRPFAAFGEFARIIIPAVVHRRRTRSGCGVPEYL
jgi:hypothetical protein